MRFGISPCHIESRTMTMCKGCIVYMHTHTQIDTYTFFDSYKKERK